jgi:DnaJ-class molecular chaperone
MTSDPYKILGLSKEAKQEHIRKAFRALAKKHHPDLNPGNKEAEEKFKEISAAHELLSDPERRAKFDKGEINATGQPSPEHQGWRNFAEDSRGFRYSSTEMPENIDDIFQTFMHARRNNSQANFRYRGQDEHYALRVTFVDAVLGISQKITLPDGRKLDVPIPPGIENGQILKLKGQGKTGQEGSIPGDVLIEISITPHPYFKREGRDIFLTLPVTLKEAILGTKISIPTPAGTVTLSIPPQSNTGTKLRLKGRGVAVSRNQPAGHLYVELQITISHSDPELERFLKDWKPRYTEDPRKGMIPK